MLNTIYDVSKIGHSMITTVELFWKLMLRYQGMSMMRVPGSRISGAMDEDFGDLQSSEGQTPDSWVPECI